MRNATVRITVPVGYLVTALEAAHIRYWCKGLVQLQRGKSVWWEVECLYTNTTDPKPARITKAALEAGLAWLATNGYTAAFGRIVSNKADASDGDVLVQAACFGGVLYA